MRRLVDEVSRTITRPEPPKPQDFDLTQEKLLRLEGRDTEKIAPFLRRSLGVIFLGTLAAGWLGAPILPSLHWALLAIILLSVWACLDTLIVRVVARHRCHCVPEAVRERWRRYKGALAKHGEALNGYHEAVRQVANQRRAAEKRQRAEDMKRLSWWLALGPGAFEEHVGQLFRLQEYSVRNVGGMGDGGVDIELRKGDRFVIVQCKAYSSWVGPGPVRDLYGTGMHRGADEAWLVTTNGYSHAAREFAQGKPLRLFTVYEVLQHTPRVGQNQGPE